MMSICACLKEPYCALLNSAAVWIDETVEKHMLESKLELKEVKISISCFLFFVCFTSRSPPCLQHNPCFVSGQGFSGWEYWVRDCVHTHTHERYPRICVSGRLRVYVHRVYSGGRGIAFTAHHLHFHTQFVMSVTRQGESWGSRHNKMAASTSQMGEEQGQWLEKGGSGVVPWPKQRRWEWKKRSNK